MGSTVGMSVAVSVGLSVRLSEDAGKRSRTCLTELWLVQGMGEPMNNYDEVASAVQMMIDPQAFALRRSAVTISTVGVIPRMLQMITDLPGVSLALSLHAPTQELRKTIVPSAKAYPLDKLMAAVDKYQMQTRQKVIAAVKHAKKNWFCNVLCTWYS